MIRIEGSAVNESLLRLGLLAAWLMPRLLVEPEAVLP